MHRNICSAVQVHIRAPYHMELTGRHGPYIFTDRDQIERALINEYETKFKWSAMTYKVRSEL